MRQLPRLLRHRDRDLRPGEVQVPATAEEPRIQMLEAGGVRWYHAEDPRAADTGWLAEHFAFHPLDLEDVASINQRPKLDVYDEYLFLVVHFPRFVKATGRLHAAELDIFIGPGYVVTLPEEAIVPLPALWERAQEQPDFRAELFAGGSGRLLYEILDRGMDACFPMLGQLGRKLRRLEDDIFEGRSSESVREISNTKQEIINFRAIIRPQRGVFRALERVKQRHFGDDLDVYFDDLTDASERIWDVLENFKEIVEALESTNESVLTHRLNDVLRVLTAASVVLLPLTLIASIWGMNVQVPGEGDAAPFYFILAGMAFILVTLIAWFRRRGWL
ncbi:MAG TPA: magnesium transporter CorA family protein [Candidatus Limnocylindria bacterium]|nr:magnesium transporter CorA family protein [Candidatus Limnocylindria bacterium]